MNKLIDLIYSSYYVLPNVSILYTLLFCIGLFGLILNRKNYLITILAIEIIMLSLSLLFMVSALHLDDVIGKVFVLLILTISAAESAISIALLIIYFRSNGFIEFKKEKKHENSD